MLRPIQAMIALQSPTGLVFGSAQSLDRDVFSVIVAGQLDPGSAVEFRLELPGLEETALGMMRVLSGRGDRNAATTYQLQVISVASDDQEAFDAWKSAVESGNIACSRSRHTSAEGWAEGALNRGTTPAERAHAVAIQEERRARLRATVRNLLQSQKKGWPDPRDEPRNDPVLASVATRSSLTPAAGRVPRAGSLPPPTAAASTSRPPAWTPPASPSTTSWGATAAGSAPTSAGATASAVSWSVPPPVNVWAPGASTPPRARTSLTPTPLVAFRPAPPVDTPVVQPSASRGDSERPDPAPAPSEVSPPVAPVADVLSAAVDEEDLFVAPPELADPDAPGPGRVLPAELGPPAPVSPDPVVTFRPGEVELQWRSVERYAADYRDSLRFRGVYVPQALGLQERTRLRVNFILPGGERVNLTGEVVQASESGAAIQFEAEGELARRLKPA